MNIDTLTTDELKVLIYKAELRLERLEKLESLKNKAKACGCLIEYSDNLSALCIEEYSSLTRMYIKVPLDKNLLKFSEVYPRWFEHLYTNLPKYDRNMRIDYTTLTQQLVVCYVQYTPFDFCGVGVDIMNKQEVVLSVRIFMLMRKTLL